MDPHYDPVQQWGPHITMKPPSGSGSVGSTSWLSVNSSSHHLTHAVAQAPGLHPSKGEPYMLGQHQSASVLQLSGRWQYWFWSKGSKRIMWTSGRAAPSKSTSKDTASTQKNTEFMFLLPLLTLTKMHSQWWRPIALFRVSRYRIIVIKTMDNLKKVKITNKMSAPINNKGLCSCRGHWQKSFSWSGNISTMLVHWGLPKGSGKLELRGTFLGVVTISKTEDSPPKSKTLLEAAFRHMIQIWAVLEGTVDT